MGVLVVEYSKCYGWKDTGKIEEQRRGDDLLQRLMTYDPITEVTPVVREPPLEV